MKTPKLPLILLFLFIYNIFNAQNTLINYGSNWDYFDSGSEPAPQGALEWYEINYDDSNWASGNAQLGYGDGDEATVTYTLDGGDEKTVTMKKAGSKWEAVMEKSDIQDDLGQKSLEDNLMEGLEEGMEELGESMEEPGEGMEESMEGEKSEDAE